MTIKIGHSGRKIVQYGKGTLKSGEMLRLKSDFDFVKKNGTKLTGNNFLLIYTKAAVRDLKFGVICGRKFNNKAVARNRARRLIKESFRLLKAQVAASHLVFIPRQKILKQHLQDVQAEMIKLLIKAGIWIKPIK